MFLDLQPMIIYEHAVHWLNHNLIFKSVPNILQTTKILDMSMNVFYIILDYILESTQHYHTKIAKTEMFVAD